MGYFVACLLAAAVVYGANLLETGGLGYVAAFEALGVWLTMSYLAAAICALPFGILRWFISQFETRKLALYGTCGGILGTGVGVLIIGSSLGLSFFLLTFTVTGFVCGVIQFGIEEKFRHIAKNRERQRS